MRRLLAFSRSSTPKPAGGARYFPRPKYCTCCVHTVVRTVQRYCLYVHGIVSLAAVFGLLIIIGVTAHLCTVYTEYSVQCAVRSVRCAMCNGMVIVVDVYCTTTTTTKPLKTVTGRRVNRQSTFHILTTVHTAYHRGHIQYVASNGC